MTAKPAPEAAALATTPTAQATPGAASPPGPRVGNPAPRRWITPLATTTGSLAACVTVGLSGEGTTLLPPCPLRATTGLDCPLCGSTRAVRSLLHLQIGDAFDHNALLMVSLPLLALAYLTWLSRTLGSGGSLESRGFPALRMPPWGPKAITTVMVAFAVARNLPVPGLRWLASPLL